MKDFLTNYWREILSLVGLAASIIICCIRKRPVKVVDLLNDLIIRLLPYCINKAEKQPKGAKLGFALSILSDLIKEAGFEMDADHLKFATEQVEIILSTPQKKGISK